MVYTASQALDLCLSKTRYAGRTCRKCGGNVRYVASRKCVTCRKAINAENYQRRKLVEQVQERHGMEAA